MDESFVFSLLRQEISSETGLDAQDIHLDADWVEDLGLDDEELERALVEVRDVLSLDEDLIGSNRLLECSTIRDLVDLLLDMLEPTD